jgi:hypothetical protein
MKLLVSSILVLLLSISANAQSRGAQAGAAVPPSESNFFIGASVSFDRSELSFEESAFGFGATPVQRGAVADCGFFTTS